MGICNAKTFHKITKEHLKVNIILNNNSKMGRNK